MSVHDFFIGGPGENREPAVLRRDERDPVPLVMDELGSGQVASSTELSRLGNHRGSAFNRFRNGNLGHLRETLAADNLGAERQQLVIRVYQSRAVYGSESGNFVYNTT